MEKKKMKVLNLYAGIGGNRKLWSEECEVTAVELNPEIAKIYQDFFPNDKVIIGDAHQYLLDHYKEFDFIWSSPPCPSHSRINRNFGTVRYIDIKLYEEIILLMSWFKGKYVVENVIPYYPVLLSAQQYNRHYFWCNFRIEERIIRNLEKEQSIVAQVKNSMKKGKYRKPIIREAQIPELQRLHGFPDFKISNKRQILRNCVNPKTGLHIFNCAFKERQEVLR